MLRVTAVWTGFPGAPGYSNFYFSGPTGTFGDNVITATNKVADVRSFFFGIRSLLPAIVSVKCNTGVSEIDEATGALTNEYVATTDPGAVQGTGTGGYAGPVGAVVSWRTGSFVAGHKLRGKTYLVPLVSSQYDPDGSLTTNATGTIMGATPALLVPTLSLLHSLHVWHRPVNGVGGAVGKVTQASVKDQAAVLRTRRG